MNLLALDPARREEVLALLEHPEEVVPLLPEAELAATLRAAGMADSGWLVEYATAEQRVACVDLDCWSDFRLSPSRLLEWIDAMIHAGPATLVAAFDELDRELWVLAMREMGDYCVAGSGDSPPGYWETQDGIVYFSAHSAEHEDRIREILSTALLDSPKHYWLLVYGAMLESQEECEAYAERWHAGRMNDLGFPSRQDAMRAYRPLRVDAAPVVDVGRSARQTREVVPMGQLPQRLAGTLVGRALAELPADRAGDLLGYVFAVANSLAVADALPLAEPESMRRALAKAVRGIDRGLAELAKARGQSPGRVLDQTLPLDLFRVGATLDPTLRGDKLLADLEQAEEGDDWNVALEEISAEDRTLGADLRPESGKS